MVATEPTRRRTAHVGAALAAGTVAPTLWFTHLGIMYALVPLSCRTGSDMPMHIATAMAVAGLVAGVTASLRWAPERSPRALVALMLGRYAGHDRSAPLLVSIALAVYFLGVVAITGITPLVVHRCA